MQYFQEVYFKTHQSHYKKQVFEKVENGNSFRFLSISIELTF